MVSYLLEKLCLLPKSSSVIASWRTPEPRSRRPHPWWVCPSSTSSPTLSRGSNVPVFRNTAEEPSLGKKPWIPALVGFIRCAKLYFHLYIHNNLNDFIKIVLSTGAPGWLSGWVSAFGSGCDPGVLRSSSASGSPQENYVSLCLCFCLSLSSLMNK